jgi:hypothetical protein
MNRRTLGGNLAAHMAGISVLLCGVLATAAAQAVMIVASDDTWVREDQPDDNRNGNDQVNARTDTDADDNDVILLKFSTASLTTPVTGASVNLYWQRNDSGTSNSLKLYGLNETDPDEATWDETTVTYNNAPGLIADGMNPTVESGAMASDDNIQDLDTANLTLLVPLQPYGPQVLNEVYSFSSAALDAFINADTNGEVSFLILRSLGTSGNQARFWPKEQNNGDTAPFLSVIPEPTSLALVSLAAMGLAVALRRR